MIVYTTGVFIDRKKKSFTELDRIAGCLDVFKARFLIYSLDIALLFISRNDSLNV